MAHFNATGELVYTGPEMLPPNENGMRDMVRVPAGTVVKIIAHFDIPGRFVWHCHLLDHEDHEMMRPFERVVFRMSGCGILVLVIVSIGVTSWIEGVGRVPDRQRRTYGTC